jgi:citronellol/citronellal dehydrogenase
MTQHQGRTALITGASRGIGRAVALRFARAGMNVVLASKTSDPHPKLEGTIHTVADEVEAAGGQALAVQCDVRFEEEVQKTVDAAVARFGGIDILVNNAGAISLTDIESTPMKRFDLMMGINARAVFLCTKLCLPHLAKSKNAHVVSFSPPVSLDPRWLKGHAAYTLSKYGMTLLTLGLAAELEDRRIALNVLWPRTVIATAAIDMLMGDDGMKRARTPEIMADATFEIVATEGLALTGQALIDEDFLRTRGVTDFRKYNVSDLEPLPDLYVGDPPAH